MSEQIGPDDIIKRMENLLNHRRDQPPSSTTNEQLDYSHPHAEIINLIQALVEGELIDGAENDQVQDKFYRWLADYKHLHSADDFSSLVYELRQRFESRLFSNYKVKLLFEVLNDLNK